ncbi:hypothetical protein KY290_002052 [Solanum tuberosum]|uniref:Uncharacterized protein n=1 Tax=Solanum tuberosum TaxID=4113 RepID=A0ABQ7WNY7_SOLTU|nr:hypothetical protein KY289_002211 [Solanum tuberosum]KAH0782454.1 hypothetical protein KY290_002052 [Solanum tuberosum]
MERSLQLSKLRIGAVVDFRRDAKLLRTSVSGPVSFRWSSVPTCSFGSRKIVMHKKTIMTGRLIQ